jgi:hypothetical protein
MMTKTSPENVYDDITRDFERPRALLNESGIFQTNNDF